LSVSPVATDEVCTIEHENQIGNIRWVTLAITVHHHTNLTLCQLQPGVERRALPKAASKGNQASIRVLPDHRLSPVVAAIVDGNNFGFRICLARFRQDRFNVFLLVVKRYNDADFHVLFALSMAAPAGKSNWKTAIIETTVKKMLTVFYHSSCQRRDPWSFFVNRFPTGLIV
jgi:hypothetical protein